MLQDRFARSRGRALARLGLAVVALLGWVHAAAAQGGAPLFTFAQLSDSQPDTSSEWTRFEQVLDTVVAAGSPGALIPRPIDFVLFAGDLVSHAKTQSEWIQFVNTINGRLTANGIPYRAVPGNHDQDGFGIGFYELYIGDSGVWESDSATVVGMNGPTVNTGWSGLRIIGFNNSNGAWNQISTADLASISSRVTAAAAAGDNAFLLGHHPHNGQSVTPLAGVLPNPSICCYAHGHSGSPHAQKGLSGISNPNVWDFNTNSIVSDAGILYYEAYATELRVYVIELVTNPTSLPAAKTIALPHALTPVVASAPVADFSASPVSGPAPLTVSFSDLSSNAPTAWSWSFGDGGSSTLQNPQRSYTVPGVYTVTLTASNSAGSNTKLRTGLVTVTPAAPTQTFTPTADARVNSSSPTSNYGTDSVLRIRAGAPTYSTYLRFTVAGTASQSVLSAKLRLSVTDPSGDGGTLYAVAGGWTESGITWNSAPAVGGAPLASAGAVSSGQWVEYDVTSSVRGDGVYDFALTSASTDSAYFSSREGANAPQLVLQTEPLAVPVADFAATPTQGAAPLAVAFSDLSTNGPTSWLWSFGDGQTSTAQNPSHSYSAPGVYDVTLSVSNSDGSDSFTRSAYVQVAAVVLPLAEFSGTPLAGAAPLAVAFSDLSANGPTSWSWSFGDGGTSTAQSPTHSFAAPGSYSVSLTATNAAGSSTKLRSAYVSVTQGAPTQSFLAAADARVASSSANSNYGADSVLRARGGTTVYNSYLRFDLSGLAGQGIVGAKLRLRVTDASDSGGSAYEVANGWTESGITWSNAPVISGAALASAGAASVGQWVELDVTSAVRGDGSVSFAVASASTNSVYYSSREGADPPQLVVETGTAVAPTADFAAAPTAGPAPLPVTFTDLSTGGPTSWLWSFGDGATSTLRSPAHSYASQGLYTVSLTVANGQGSDGLTRTALVNVGPPLSIVSYVPVADAKVSSANALVNYGSEPNLRLRTATAGSWQSFLRFDVAGLLRPVVRATLRLRVDDGSKDGGTLYAVTSAWSEGSLTWSTAPPLDLPALASLGTVATGQWVEVDVTSLVTGNGTYAFGLGNQSSDTAYYGSRESANPPQLVVEYQP